MPAMHVTVSGTGDTVVRSSSCVEARQTDCLQSLVVAVEISVIRNNPIVAGLLETRIAKCQLMSLNAGTLHPRSVMDPAKSPNSFEDACRCPLRNTARMALLGSSGLDELAGHRPWSTSDAFMSLYPPPFHPSITEMRLEAFHFPGSSSRSITTTFERPRQPFSSKSRSTSCWISSRDASSPQPFLSSITKACW